MATNKITLAAGCFWCIEGSIRRLKGVSSAISGYTGGEAATANYKSVCSGSTGHAEVVQVEYNPLVIGTDKLLQIFFYLHDPTQLNRQGADIGTQYRSAIFYHDEEQKKLANDMIKTLDASGKYKSKIVTEVSKMTNFYPAEEYHQDYFRKNPGAGGYCAYVVKPKIEGFMQTWRDFLKE